MKPILVFYILAPLFLAACMSAARQNALEEFSDVYNEAAADGVISEAEAALLGVKWKLVMDAPAGGGFDWTTVGAAAGTALLAMFPLLRYIPNKFVIGQKEAEAVDKAAGIK